MTVYMKVTKDKYELPVAIADTIQQLSIMTNASVNSIRSAINHAKARGGHSIYVKVTIEDE